MLAPHTQQRFDAAAQERGCPADQTLGEYIAMLERNSATGKTHGFTGRCGEFPAQPSPVDPPADAAYWYCAIDAYTTDAEPWNYELRLRIRRRDAAVDLATFGCPGSP